MNVKNDQESPLFLHGSLRRSSVGVHFADGMGIA